MGGVLDPKLGGVLSEELGCKVSHIGVVPELVRGVRMHFAKLVKGLTNAFTTKAQLGLGHSYSRAKVKFNVHKSDNMIIQVIALLDQLDKDVNTFAMRIREWYGYHFPELVKIVGDNLLYARGVKALKNRKEIKAESILETLEEIVMDSAKAKAILDLINIDRFADRVIALAEYRKELIEYLRSKMDSVAPNLAALVGDAVGARLISHAGSLTNLAKYPASTVQILGAEKALFRALKTRGNTPKYGLIFHSSFIGKAGAKNKGRISRYLANKCSIASRIDCFSETSTKLFGEKLKEQVEDRLKFYDSGDLPKKNVDAMKEAIDAVKAEASEFTEVVSKKSKKNKKRKAEAEAEDPAVEASNEDKPKKKKAKVEAAAEVKEPEPEAEDPPSEEKKKKKKKKKDKKAE